MKLARAASLIALLLSVVTVAVLLSIDPSGACPGWQLRHLGGASAWVLLAWGTTPTLASIFFIVARWDRSLQKMAEVARHYQSRGKMAGRDSPFLPPEDMLTRICLFGAAFSQIPLLYVVVDCLIV